MFQQWDGDRNGELSTEELRPLDEDKNEKCLAPFLDRCDDDADDAVTLDEWCDCFAWADDVRHEPPCHAAKHKQDPHLLGIYATFFKKHEKIQNFIKNNFGQSYLSQ